MFDELAKGPEIARNNELLLSYELRGFKGNASKPFNVTTQISANFGEFHYVINVASTNGENRLYGQPISGSERAALLRPALEKLFAQIKKHSGEK